MFKDHALFGLHAYRGDILSKLHDLILVPLGAYEELDLIVGT